MPTSERSLTAQEHFRFKNHSAIGLQMISDVPCSRTSVIVAGVDSFIRRRKNLLAPLKGVEGDNAEAAAALGTVWGNQVAREFGWEWICVMIDGEEHFVAAAPDRALVIFAHEYVRECLDSKTMDCAIALSFDMLRAGAIEPPAALSYTSMMKQAKRTHSRPRDRLATFMKKVGSLRPHTEWSEACMECEHV
jgi:hypothetical protein